MSHWPSGHGSRARRVVEQAIGEQPDEDEARGRACSGRKWILLNRKREDNREPCQVGL